ncbi:chitotriosidase-1-like [Lissotriton helveticus]
MGTGCAWTGFFIMMILSSCSATKLICYYTNWAQYRPGVASFTPQNIDPNLCTHLIYSFAGISSSHKLNTSQWNDEQLFEDFNRLKTKNPGLKTLLSVGGWLLGTKPFTDMVSTDINRKAFVDSVPLFLRNHDFDGLELNWQFPGSRGSPPEDKTRFTVLIQELSKEFHEEAVRSGRDRLLLSAAVASERGTVISGYEISAISRDLDFINVQTFDFHGYWQNRTGHVSPLYRDRQRTASLPHSSVDSAMRYWRDNGAPAEKLILGVPFYGQTFKLSSSDTGVGAPISGHGAVSPYITEGSMWPYYEICKFRNEATTVWIEEQKVPYSFKGAEWVGYDNTESIKLKVEYLKAKGFGGAMVWALDMDDFTGTFCDKGKYPLLQALHAELNPGWCSNKADDLYEDPQNPAKFYICTTQKGQSFFCPQGMLFFKACKCCNWPVQGE